MKCWLMVVSIFLICSSAALAADGKALFESNGCGACHAPATKLVGPALSKIAAAYAGKKPALVDFLDGSGRPVVDPGQFSLMKPNLEATKALTGEERSALADYILSH